MKTIVILHGWGSDIRRWLPVKKLFANNGFKIYLPKLPGDRIRNTADYSTWVNNYTRNLKPFYLLGHSFGGQVAIDFAVRYPKRVKKLILIASAGIRRPSLKRKIMAPLAKLLRGHVREKVKSFLYRLLLATDYYRANPQMRKTMAIILTEDQQSNMKKITTPTLLIWGDCDRYTPLRDGRLTQRLIPQSRLVIIPDAKHGLPFTHAEQIKEKILWFIGLK